MVFMAKKAIFLQRCSDKSGQAPLFPTINKDCRPQRYSNKKVKTLARNPTFHRRLSSLVGSNCPNKK